MSLFLMDSVQKIFSTLPKKIPLGQKLFSLKNSIKKHRPTRGDDAKKTFYVSLQRRKCSVDSATPGLIQLKRSSSGCIHAWKATSSSS